MLQPNSVRAAERKVLGTTFQDGLWDLFLGCFVLLFALAPVLSSGLGDFWSSAVFLPFWGLVALVIWLVRRYVVAPRMGVVRLGPRSKKKLVGFNIVMIVVNVAALILGIVAVTQPLMRDQVFTLILGLSLLAGFSVAAYLLGLARLYVYGLLLGLAPQIGEWLYTQFQVTHHGFPITFGITAGVILLTGLVIFLQFLRNNPVPGQGPLGEV